MGWTPIGIQPFHYCLERVFLLFSVKITLTENACYGR